MSHEDQNSAELSVEQMQALWLPKFTQISDAFVTELKYESAKATAEKFDLMDCLYEKLDKAGKTLKLGGNYSLNFVGFVVSSCLTAYSNTPDYLELRCFHDSLLALKSASGGKAIDTAATKAKKALCNLNVDYVDANKLLSWFAEPVEFPKMAMDSLDWLDAYFSSHSRYESLPSDILGDDPFDLCLAHQMLENDYNVGGWLQDRPSNRRRNESTGVQLHRIGFIVASPLLSADKEESVQMIYDRLREQYELPGIEADQPSL